MNDITYPRSPRETMTGWSYLPRYIDKKTFVDLIDADEKRL